MSESTPTGDWLTTSQAAARLRVSERTLLKRIKSGEVQAEKRPLDGGGVAWRVQLSPDRAGSEMESAPEAERKNAPEARRNPFERESAAERKRAGTGTEHYRPERNETESETELAPIRAGTGTEPETEAESTPNGAGTERLLAHLETENQFLRSLLEARDRDAAELRAALREALRLAPKQLPHGASDGAQGVPIAQVSQTTPAPIIGAVRATQRETRSRDAVGLRGWLLKILRG